ncbi:MAG: hypothetical protein R3199_12885 [Gemmatimonadota bacterium]|nr:hypothetical protein [Gemmatimonadota bacterium]
MAEIRVTSEGNDEFLVEVEEESGTSEHRVTVTDGDLVRFAPGSDKEALLEESFRFLLEREPKESILSTFELPAIARYFPEYPEEIRERMGG